MPRRPPKSDSLREAALLLGLDPDRLTEADRLRCQLVGTLRSAIDHEQAKAEAGSSADLAKLVTAVEALTKLLPANVTAPPARFTGDPRKKLVEIVMNAILREPVGAVIHRDGRAAGPAEVSDAPPQRALPAPDAPKPDAPKASAPQATDTPAPPVGPLEDLLSARPCDQAGGSAGFRQGPPQEPWRDYAGNSTLDSFCWQGAKGRSW